ncbi:MAG: hypothetical protein V4520_07025 [Bacteroidota bacterium]
MHDVNKISGERLEMLLEAMEMLHDLRPHMAMFRNQHYCKLKKRVTLHTKRCEVSKNTYIN